jgi:disulfide bond formation protein DsbB
MSGLAFRMQPSWPLLALLASLAMLAAAHAFERFGGLAPCALCLKQRDVYWGAAAIGAAGFFAARYWPRITLRRAIAALLGLAFLSGAIVAFYHVGVEQHWPGFVARCDAVRPSDIRAFSLDQPLAAPKCDEIAWSLFGVSMAGYNTLVSLLLAAASFCVAFAPAPQTEEA